MMLLPNNYVRVASFRESLNTLETITHCNYHHKPIFLYSQKQDNLDNILKEVTAMSQQTICI